MKRRSKPRPGKRKDPPKVSHKAFDSQKHHMAMAALCNDEIEKIDLFVSSSRKTAGI